MSSYNYLDNLQQKQYDFVDKQGWYNKTRLEYLALVDEKYYLELADIALRLVDLAEVEGISLKDYISKKMEINAARDFTGKLK